MSESLPKYMLLDQTSEQIRDRRIMPITEYVEQGDRAIVNKKKVITNTIPLSWKLSNQTSIYNLQYSSKYEVLLIATKDEIAIKTTRQLEEDLIKGNQNQKTSMTIKFSGELFLSPDEEIVAICSESLIQFAKIASLKKANNIEAPPIPNVNESNHYLWVDNTHFLGWKFEGKAVLYTIDTSNLEIRQEKELPSQCCTGASVIHEHLFLIQKMNIKIFSFFAPGEGILFTQIDMTDPNHESPYFQFSYIIDIFKINIKDNVFTPDDIFGLAVVFYDEEEDATDERYLTFAKGDIFKRDTLEMRGYENFYSTKTSRELFYINEEDKEKASFSIKRIVTGGFICIMLEKSQKIYVIDPLESFERLNIYDIKSKHELKNEQGKFLQGMALMKNMLNVERIAPSNAEDLLKQIINKYNGEFMSLYFKDKESNLTVAFPSSILAIGGEKFYRRYAISTIDGIDDDNNSQILEKISKIQKSPHIISEYQRKDLSEKIQIKQKKEVKVEVPIVKKQEKKSGENAVNPFNIKPSESAANLFGKAPQNSANVPSSAASLFSKGPVTEKAANLFGARPQNTVNIFGKPADSAASLFGKATENTINMFGKASDTSAAPLESLFAKKPDTSKPNSLFPNVPNLFATNNASPSQPAEPSVASKQVKVQEKQTKKEQPKPSLNFISQQPNNNLFGNQTFGSAKVPDASKKDESISKDNKHEDKVPPEAEAKISDNPFFGAPSSGSLFGNLTAAEDKSKGAKIFTNNDKNAMTDKLPSPSISTTGAFGTKNDQTAKPSPFFVPSASNSSFTFGSSSKPLQNLIKASQKEQTKPQVKIYMEKTNGQSAKPIIPQPSLNKQEPNTTVDATKPPVQKIPQPPVIDKKKMLLQGIRSKVSSFISWQKQAFGSSKSENSLPVIKDICKKQELTLKNLDSKIFGESIEEIKDSIKSSMVSNPRLDLILSKQSEAIEQTQASFNKIVNKYEQLSNKMIYYINLLGKKKQVNLRASITQSQMIDRAAANLRRITEENEKKIMSIEQESIAIQETINKILEQRMNKKKKKLKANQKKRLFNFQDFDSDEAEHDKRQEGIINNHARNYSFISNNDIRPVVISLNNINLTPKIMLPSFSSQAPSTSPPKQQPKKAQPQPSLKTSGPSPVPAVSFTDKIPPKKDKVPVPVIKKPEVKKEEQKQAISQVMSEGSEQQLEIPAAKRQISSIQPVQIKGIKLPQAAQKAPTVSIKPPAQSSQPDKSKSIFGGKGFQLLPPKAEENNMLFSQTTSVFSSKANPVSLLGNPKKTDEPEGKEKEGEAKAPAATLFSPQGNIFNLIKPPADSKGKQAKEQMNKAPSADASLKLPADKKQTNIQGKQQAPSPLQPANITNMFKGASSSGTASLFSLNPNSSSTSLFGNMTAQKTEKKEENKNNADASVAAKVESIKKQGANVQNKSEAGGLNAMFANLGVNKDDKKVQANKNIPVPPVPAPTAPQVVGQDAKTKTAQSKQNNNIFNMKPNQAGLTGLANLFGKNANQPANSEKKAEEKHENAPSKQETVEIPKKSENVALSQAAPVPVPAPSPSPALLQPTAEDKKKIVTDQIAQSNNASTNAPVAPIAPVVNDATNAITKPPLQPQQSTTNVFQNANSGFMGNSFGNNAFKNAPPVVPQFGVGNNKFLANPNPQQQNTTGFDPTKASFGFTSTNQKTFNSISNTDGNIFQQNQANNQFQNHSNMFAQNSNSNPSFNSNSPFGNNPTTNVFAGSNQGGSFGNNNQMFNPNSQNNSFNNAFSNPNNNGNSFNNNNNFNNNNAFNNNNQGNAMFNASNVFSGNNNNNQANTSVFANNSNNNSMFNANNNTNNSNTGNNTNSFNLFSGSNNNSSGNFLSKMNHTNQVAPPPANAVNSHLMQMRK